MKIPSDLIPALLLSSCLGLSAGAAFAQDDDEFFLGDLDGAAKAHLKGEFSKARARYREILEYLEEELEEDRPGPAIVLTARQGLFELELVRGRYADALEMVEGWSAAEQADPGTILLAARAQQLTGQYETASAEMRKLISAGKGGLEAHFRLGVCLIDAGSMDEGRKVLEDAIAISDRINSGEALEIYYVARCHMELGGRQHMEQASALLVDSTRVAPNRPEARTAYGQLVFEAYRESAGLPNAEKFIKPVLEENGEVEAALLVMYRSRRYNMFLEGGKTAGFLRRLMAVNPNSGPGLVEQASGLIGDRRFEAAGTILDRALTVNPRDRVALSHRAALAFVLHDEDGLAEFRKRALAARPDYPEIDRIFGDHLVTLYRFPEAIPYYERSLEHDENYVPAMHGLAKALVYTGRGEEAAEWLTKAKEFESGFSDTWRKNALLVESRLAEEYEAVETDNFLILLHKDDRAVLEGYFSKWFEDARRDLGEKYGYRPENKIRVEVLHEWVDFSVRTIGFRGFMALGACFGEFITMVSPSDLVLRQNDFMWAATAWHEYAHVLTVSLSNRRVPRWLTEGMSVYEESAKNRAWERGMVRDLLDAYHNEEITPLRELNGVFRGSRILFGYYQGGLIVEYLSGRFGFDKVVSMLKAYGEDQGTEAIFESTFGIRSAEFDADFLEWVVEEKINGLKIVPRFSEAAVNTLLYRVQDAPEDLEARVKLGWGYIQRGLLVDAGIQVGAVLRQDPNHAEGNLLHGDLLGRREEFAAAGDAFARGFAGGADDFESRLHYARLLEMAGDLEGAQSQYQAAKACWPRCTDQNLAPQLHIARILVAMGKQTEAMMEIASFCNLTARAFQPRLELAAYQKDLGNREAEAKYLAEAVQIDPFMLSLHDRLGDAYEALDRKSEARAEYEVALAVPQAMDRATITTPAGAGPATGQRSRNEVRGSVMVKIAKIAWTQGEKEQAQKYLDLAESEAPGTDIADEVYRLRALWKLVPHP